MRTLLALLLLSASAALLPAQQSPAPSASATPPPLPPGPLLKRAPDPSQWEITFTYPGKPAGDAPEAPTPASGRGAKSKPAQHVSVVKSGAVWHVVTVDVTGAQTETWCQGSVQVNQRAGWAKPLLSDGATLYDLLYVDYSQTDFPGCEWISARNYVGVQKYAGRDCLVFQDKVVLQAGEDAPAKSVRAALPSRLPVVPAGVGRVEVPLTACIDADSRLPVALRRGDEVAVYQFGNPPDAALSLPQNVSEILEARAKRLRELRAKPGKPY